MTRTYLHCGLRVRSELDLPLTPTDGSPDVDVVWGPSTATSQLPPPGTPIAESVENGQRLFSASQYGSGFLVRFPGCGEFAIAGDLATVEVRRDPSGEHSSLLPVLMAGAVAAIVHELRGATILHASAVAVRGRALAFMGRSGQGKSTMAAWLCSRGASLVADDVLRVDVDPVATCVGAATELRLRRVARPLAEHHDAATRQTVDGRTALAPAAVVSDALPLAAIVIPRPSRTTPELAMEEVPAVSRLVALLTFPRIAGWTLDAVLARRFDTLAQLADRVPVLVAEVPWGPPFDPSVADALIQLAG